MDEKNYPVSGASETEKGRSHYFSWINNTNEGSTAEQTLINLEFFNMMNRKYGMELEIYAWDAGNLDGSRGTYGTFESERFRSRYPEGYAPIVKKAAEGGTRLGLWGGPDGFGKTEEDAEKRIELMTSLCRDYHFELFKFDGVCGTLRPAKRKYFCRMMEQCRKYSPDLILLNHRLDFGKGNKYATTFLWEGMETYVDVFLCNKVTAPHNRAGIFYRGNVPGFKRLTDDHGTCISSSIDYFEDDLIYQAFGRNLILSPSIYGNPWLMKDSELPRLARIFNLHRDNGDILVNAISLESLYGFGSVSRGSDSKRFIVLGNGTWETKNYNIGLNESIGLKKCSCVRVITHHPYEQLIGDFGYGESVNIECLPFRAVLLEVSDKKDASYIIENCCYEVIHEKDGKADKINIVANEEFDIREKAPVKAGVAEECEIPENAEQLYEKTMFSLDNDTLELRSLRRSGPTAIPEVQAARDAFFGQKTYRIRGNDGYTLFDGDPNSQYDTKSVYYFGSLRIKGGALRVDFGKGINAVRMEIEYFSIDKDIKEVKKIPAPKTGSFSTDLQNWKEFGLSSAESIADAESEVIVDSVHNIIKVSGKRMKATYSINGAFRYIRLPECVDRIYSLKLFDKDGNEIVPDSPKVNNLMADYSKMKTVCCEKCSVHIDGKYTNHFIAVACNGKYDDEGVYCAAEIEGGKLAGAPSRAPAYKSNVFEHLVSSASGNYTYYIPITEDMLDKDVTIYALFNSKPSSKDETAVYICENHR